MKGINKIKAYLMDGLEDADESGVLRGEYVCHEDIPDKTPEGFDAHFTACGEDENDTYLVLIQKID